MILLGLRSVVCSLSGRSSWLVVRFLYLLAIVIPGALPAGAVAAELRAAPPAAAALTDRDGDKILDALEARLAQAAPDDSFDVVVSFAVPLEQIRFPLIQAQLGAFGPAIPLAFVRAVATRLTAAQIAALARSDLVERVEGDEKVYAQDVPSQKYFGVAAARADLGLTGDGDGNPDLFTKADNTIAVIDTGIDASHVQLDGGKVIGWVDLVNGRSIPYDDSVRTVDGKQVDLGHGTHVASIAAGKAVGDQSGVAPGAALVGVKALDASGAGQLSTVVQALQWCVQNRSTYGIRAINLSLGSALASDGTDVVSQAVDAAAAAGLTVLCAAGNSGPGQFSVGSPGAAAGALTVGAVADPDRGGIYLARFSSRGPTLDYRVKPDVLAPGVGIVAAKSNSGSDYIAYSGTSMATPFVSGFVALMLQASPNLSVTDIYNGITQTARDLGPPGPDYDYGSGLLDSVAALRLVRSTAAGEPDFPGHSLQTGAITRQAHSVSHTFEVAGTRFPIAITLIISDWFLGFPDLDCELIDPDGKSVALSDGTTRQETILFTPTKGGPYTLRVYGYSRFDAGGYLFDVSADLAAGGATGPP